MELNHSEYLDILIKLAEDLNPVANARMAACIVFKGRIISFGFNKLKSDPFQKKYSSNEFRIFTHAEISAIKNAKKRFKTDDLSKMTLYIARVKRPDTNSKLWIPGLAKPCIGCQECIIDHNITNVVYTKNSEIVLKALAN